MIKWITDMIKELSGARFFGKVIITFNAGKIVNVEKRVSIKPPGD